MPKRKRPVRKKVVQKNEPIEPALSKNQRPLTSYTEAKRQIATVEREFPAGRQKFIAYTNLLSRAFAAKGPNRDVIKLLSGMRDSIAIKWPGEKPFEKKAVLKAVSRAEGLSETTNMHINALKSQLKKMKLGTCSNLVHVLVSDTPLRESGVVANLLQSMATQAEINWLTKKGVKGNPDCAKLVMKMYSASGELYKKRGFHDQATQMFEAADLLKARYKFGF